MGLMHQYTTEDLICEGKTRLAQVQPFPYPQKLYIYISTLRMVLMINAAAIPADI